MKIDYTVIGNSIKNKRKQKGMTQAKLAELSGIEPSNISHIERAATKLSLPTLISIANALECSLDELVYNNIKQCEHVSNAIINELIADCDASELTAIAQIIKTTKSILRKMS